ncbi:hypothetical protein [Parashewanella curva]|uniref:hypothetical protein n=1 Tax=Parashewanella curva TaxID=2338552 RepID=UPI00140534CE|nr:hypothetical protein [Parashewanella curva]
MIEQKLLNQLPLIIGLATCSMFAFAAPLNQMNGTKHLHKFPIVSYSKPLVTFRPPIL